MFSEIGFIQRFSLFLGQPTLAFALVLLGLLVFCSLGSTSVHGLRSSLSASTILFLISGILIISAIGTAFLNQESFAASYALRSLMTLAVIGPVGFAMGTALPMGMSIAQERGDDYTMWYWVVNGAFSVIGSVLAMLFSMLMGITATLLIAGGLYFATAIILKTMIRQHLRPR